MPSAVDTVRRTWGADAPAWVMALAEECDRGSQRKAAALIGYTAGTVNHVLQMKRRVAGLGDVEAAVVAALMTERVRCPVLGEISVKRCHEERSRPFLASADQLRKQLFRICRDCQRKGAGHEHA